MFNLIVNNGSASRKYALYRGKEPLYCVHYEIVINEFLKTKKDSKKETEEKIDSEIFNDALGDFINELTKNNIIKTVDDINKIAIRIVAPGVFFQQHHIVDEKFLEMLDDKKHLSPLHIDPVQREISDLMDKIPNVPIYAVSDSVFYKDKPQCSSIYAYPKEVTEKLELYRYGYHGISVSSVVKKVEKQQKLPEKMIICHLGGGSSITAIKNGKPIDNTMGYSPLEGIPMATRIGNVDPNSLFAIMEEYDYEIPELQNFLYKECGFKGISNLSGDTRAVLKEAQLGNKDASLALEYYAYEIKKIIGGYRTILGGLDTIIFTGTIGNRSADIRKRICLGLEETGIILDDANNKIMVNSEGKISLDSSDTEILTIETNENGEMNEILESIS